MHEQSLIRTLLKQVDQIRREQGGREVSEVRIQIGPLSGVEPLLLITAFNQLVTESSSVGAELALDWVPLLATCEACDDEFEIRDFVFRCPQCRGNVQVIQGDDIQLVSVSLRDVLAEETAT
jgi:hydrogenase nickel incorporation protein HypA/HybF